MKTNITKNVLIDIGAGERHDTDPNSIAVRIEARAADDGEIISLVTVSTEANGKAESVRMPAEIFERVAKALAEYRESNRDHRRICVDHGYTVPFSYECAKCNEAKIEEREPDVESPEPPLEEPAPVVPPAMPRTF